MAALRSYPLSNMYDSVRSLYNQGMKRDRISQKEAIFYTLYTLFRAKDEKYLPVHQLMGEVFCKELNKWGYVSYECSARASEMMKENPGLFMRTHITGRSGARYYGYRISPNAKPELVKDEKLLAFYRKIGGVRKPSEREVMLRDNAKRVRDFDAMP